MAAPHDVLGKRERAGRGDGTMVCSQSPLSVTAAPTAQSHAQCAQAAVLPTVVVFFLLVHDHGGSLRLRRRVVGCWLLRGRIVALRRRLEAWLGRWVVGVLLWVAHDEAAAGTARSLDVVSSCFSGTLLRPALLGLRRRTVGVRLSQRRQHTCLAVRLLPYSAATQRPVYSRDPQRMRDARPTVSGRYQSP